MKTKGRVPYIWDYDMSKSEFVSVLRGEQVIGRLDQDWAAIRLLEYAPYRDIVHLLGYSALVNGWPRWQDHIRSDSRRRGLSFLAAYLPVHHPELLA